MRLLNDLTPAEKTHLILNYNEYIQNANDEDFYDSGWRPVGMTEFINTEFEAEQEHVEGITFISHLGYYHSDDAGETLHPHIAYTRTLHVAGWNLFTESNPNFSEENIVYNGIVIEDGKPYAQTLPGNCNTLLTGEHCSVLEMPEPAEIDPGLLALENDILHVLSVEDADFTLDEGEIEAVRDKVLENYDYSSYNEAIWEYVEEVVAEREPV